MTDLRDPRADLDYFHELQKRVREGLELGGADVVDPVRVARPATHARDAQRYTRGALSMVRCAYGMGEPVSVIAEHADVLLHARALELRARRALPEGPHSFTEEPAYYVLALQIVSIARLTDRPAATVREAVEQTGLDAVYDALAVAYAEVPSPADSVIYPKPYERLLRVIKAAPEDRPALMGQFLKVWYNQSRRTAWWGSHLQINTGGYLYAGYWCFEAAAITKLLEIDDSSYRDNEYYPRDLL